MQRRMPGGRTPRPPGARADSCALSCSCGSWPPPPCRPPARCTPCPCASCPARAPRRVLGCLSYIANAGCMDAVGTTLLISHLLQTKCKGGIAQLRFPRQGARLPPVELPVLYLQQDGISTEELQRLHGLQVQGHHRVVIVDSVVHDQAVWRLLPFEYGCAKILLLLALAVRRKAETVSTLLINPMCMQLLKEDRGLCCPSNTSGLLCKQASVMRKHWVNLGTVLTRPQEPEQRKAPIPLPLCLPILSRSPDLGSSINSQVLRKRLPQRRSRTSLS